MDAQLQQLVDREIAQAGLTHLAAAVGARTVGIYCGSDPALTGLYGASNARNAGALGRTPSVAEVLRSLQ